MGIIAAAAAVTVATGGAAVGTKEQIDMQLYSQAIKDYFKSKPNLRKLLKYGKVFEIEKRIRTYMEVL